MTDLASIAAPFGDNHQHYFVEIPGFAYAAPSVQSFEVHEALGDLYRAEITLTHPDPLARGDVLNREATFSMLPMLGTPRRFAGCVTAFSRLQRTRDGYVYRLVIEPHVARLRHTPASRIFQKQKVPAIVEAILRRHGFKGHQFVDADIKLTRRADSKLTRGEDGHARWPPVDNSTVCRDG